MSARKCSCSCRCQVAFQVHPCQKLKEMRRGYVVSYLILSPFHRWTAPSICTFPMSENFLIPTFLSFGVSFRPFCWRSHGQPRCHVEQIHSDLFQCHLPVAPLSPALLLLFFSCCNA